MRPAKQYLYYVILSPVGAYYPEGMNPVKILTEEHHVRAVEGGVGGAKTGANYAASLYAAEEAKHKGYTQVLWLDGGHRKYIDEVGTMNIMVRIGDEVITPPLAGSILAGVTRDSVAHPDARVGVRVSERPISIDEVMAAAADGHVEGDVGHGHGRRHLARGRAGLPGPPHRDQRRAHRRADPEALRHDRRHPVRDGPRPPRLDVSLTSVRVGTSTVAPAVRGFEGACAPRASGEV